MKEQVGERDIADGDAQIRHVREIGLSSLAGPMPLFKDDVLLRPMQRFPLRDVSLQGTHLDRLIAPRVPLAQQRKQRRPEAPPGLGPTGPPPMARLLQMGSGAFARCGDVSLRSVTFLRVHTAGRFARSFPPSRRRLVGWLLCVWLA